MGLEKTYHYLGDRFTAPALKGAPCTAVRRADGKCIRGKSKMLVSFSGVKTVVLARLLRKVVGPANGSLMIVPCVALLYVQNITQQTQ